MDPEKRKPDTVNDNPLLDGLKLSGTVIVRYINKSVSESFSALAFAFFNHPDNIWENSEPDQNFLRNKSNQIIEWYEEIEIESLFPDEEHSLFVARNASDGNFQKQMSHQEGQSFFKNQILKMLKK